MRRRRGSAGAVALLAVGTALGCGGRSHSAQGTPDSESGGAGAPAAGSGSLGGAGMSGGGSSAGGAGTSAAGGPTTVDYVGIVLASVMSDGQTKSYAATAAFSPGASDVRLDACSTCCCYHHIGLSLPRQPPNAGTIELTTTESDHALVSLVPSMNHLLRSWVLNQWGVAGASDYELVESEPWAPSQALRVTAQGNDVHAFAGEIRTGAGFDGLTPDLESQGLALDRTRDFELTWLPEDPDEWITLVVQQLGGDDGFCICSAPDASGSVTLPRDEVAKFSAGSGRFELTRSLTAGAPSDNASVTLVSQVGVTGGVVFQ